MKNWSLAVLLASNTMLAGVCLAEEAKPLAGKIPTEEKAFVEAINKHNKATIVAQFGEPVKAEDVKVKGSGRIAASIWHYHKINTAEDGSYYPTTELDFIDDKVVQVVFLNHENLDDNDDGKVYELPQDEPNLVEPNM